MASFCLTLEYDGAGFVGWQRQAHGRSVQGTLEEALCRLARRKVAVVGAGRTDAGVHAEGQVASVRLETRLDAATLLRALNANLPRDLAVVVAREAPDDFHARFHARAKLYRYRVWNGEARSPLRGPRQHHVPQPLDVPAMVKGAVHLEGCHDFASFQGAGSDVKSTVRILHRVCVEGAAGGEVSFEVAGDGFLRHMVRNIVGTLLEVGGGRRAPDSLPALLQARERGQAGPTAPAHGLALVHVDYAAQIPDFPAISGA